MNDDNGEVEMTMICMDSVGNGVVDFVCNGCSLVN